LEIQLVAKFSLRRFEDQAKASVAVSLASVVTFIALVGLIIRRLDWSEFSVVYGAPTRLAILVATAVTVMLSVGGFGLGINSVGQRRNEKQNLSWLGFFIGATVLVLTVCLFAFFYLRGEPARL
jgi:hypothetical protein